jgi:ABC-type glycerol-3-phosphate transport system substrate-binding protein
MAQKIRLGAAALLLLGGVSAASAHHSFAIFDHTQSYTLKGTVTSFHWTNPHGYLELDVAEGPKGIDHYTVELTSINMLRRAGWKSSDVQAGDVVTAVVAPLLNDAAGGLLLELKMADGRTLVPPVPAIDSFKKTP